MYRFTRWSNSSTDVRCKQWLLSNEYYSKTPRRNKSGVSSILFPDRQDAVGTIECTWHISISSGMDVLLSPVEDRVALVHPEGAPIFWCGPELCIKYVRIVLGIRKQVKGKTNLKIHCLYRQKHQSVTHSSICKVGIALLLTIAINCLKTPTRIVEMK